MRVAQLLFASWCVVARQHAFKVTDATPPTSQSLISPEIDEFVDNLITEWHSPGGVSVAVVKKTVDRGWAVETKGYGVAKADGTKVTSESLFAIASNSKLFATLSAGLLIANKSLDQPLSWRTKIASLIPEWGLMDPTASSGATIVDLMSHRTGLPRHDFAFSLEAEPQDMISRLRHLKPSAEFRDIWQYNNLMFAVLAHLPSTLVQSHPSFTQYVQDYIFDPLGMSSTTYSFNVANSSGHLASGFARQRTNSTTLSPFDAGIPRALPFWAQKDDHMHCGPGGVITNAIDMATWLQTLLLDGRNPRSNFSVIPKAAIDTVASGITTQPSATFTYPPNSPIVYGGGQAKSTYRGRVIVGHDGSVPGFKSMIYRLPADGIGIAVMSNDEDLGSYINMAIHHRLLDHLLDLPPLDSKKMAEDLMLRDVAGVPAPIQRRPNATLPSMGWENLAGVYSDAGYGQIELCSVSPSLATSASCRSLMSNISVALPGAIESDVPALLGRRSCESETCSFVRLSHFEGNLFNLSILYSFPTGSASEPFWTAGLQDPSALAEFGHDERRLGLAVMGGVWGSGLGVPSPSGRTVKERAEVWFGSSK